MTMPATVYVGLFTPDADFIDPREVAAMNRDHSLHVRQTPDECAEDTQHGVAFVAQYQFVRLLKVTQTVPPPVVKVEAV